MLFYVGHGYDDATERGDGACFHTVVTSLIWSHTTPTSLSYFCSGFRFPSVTIPKNSVINSAIISLHLAGSNYDDINCIIYAHDVDDSDNFNDNLHVISETFRPRTAANVEWAEDDLYVFPEEFIPSPDISAVIQEIINRGGWASGNALTLLFIAKTDVLKTVNFWAYDQDPIYAARLEITWTPPPIGYGYQNGLVCVQT